MPGAGRQTTSAGRAAAASSGSHCTISGVVSSEGHPRPGRKARATAIIAESIFDFQWTFERRGKILEPIREVSIHDEELATRRFSMMRIMARWMKAATVLA
jgi:hypothetical protein